MRVVFPAVLDNFACADRDCPCRVAMRSAQLKPSKHAIFPLQQAEIALLNGAERVSRGTKPAADAVAEAGDYPLVAVRTPTGVELSFATMCMQVRKLLAENQEPMTLANAEGGWRVPLRMFVAADGYKLVRLSAGKTVRWREFAALREIVLYLISDQTQTLLSRLARIAATVEKFVDQATAQPDASPLTARMFLAFRAFAESRMAAADPEQLAKFAGQTLSLWGSQAGMTANSVPPLLDALAGDWRAHLVTWVVAAEREGTAAMEVYLGARLAALPFDRDLSISRGYAEFFEGFAMGLRYAAALGEVSQRRLTSLELITALSLGETFVASSGQALPPFESPKELHERGPRMADLDMTFECIV